MLNSLISAFLMYSRIPMPQIAWKESNRRYALGWFPAVGVVIGALLIVWRLFCTWIGFGQFLFAAGAALLPILVTGGIHLDGYCDVTDALASFAGRDARLEIMSDPHIGSFAVMRVCLYLILQTALFSQCTDIGSTGVIACGFVLSRALSGLSAVSFRCAKQTGTLQSFVRPSDKHRTVCMVCCWGAAAGIGMMFCNYSQGTAAFGAAILVFLYYRVRAYQAFGGITGDLCGWFLQLCEIWMPAAALFAAKLTEVLK